MTLAGAPQPFGWAPDRHLRVEVSGGDCRSVIIRQSWSAQGHEAEVYLYRSVLAFVHVRTPTLLGVFQLEHSEPGWMVLEDLGTEVLQPSSRQDREAVLYALGVLHGATTESQPTARLLAPLPRFGAAEIDAGYPAVLAVADPSSGVPDWMAPFAGAILKNMLEATCSLVHGDVEFSNMLATADGVALIDWEKATYGPASVDLGPLMEYVDDERELENYVRGWGLTSELSFPVAREWARLGRAYDCIRWVCHYLRARSNGADPGPGWRAQYYDPRIEWLRQHRDEAGQS